MLTPIAKSWPSQWCLEGNSLAIQVLGGYGYTRDYPVEQFYRDNRLNPIHEGTHGIQGLDLLGRKVGQANGAGVKALAGRIMADVSQAHAFGALSGHAEALANHLAETVGTTRKLAVAASENPRLGLANATIYLDMFGHVVIAWMWLRQALVASRKLEAGGVETAFLSGKLAACRYFFVHELPKTRAQRELLDSLDDTTLSMQTDWF